MDSVDSNLVDLDLNGLFNENQAQDENCCDTETQTIMEVNVVNNLPDAENKHVPSSDEIKELQELVANLKTSSQQEKARLEAQIKEAEMKNDEHNSKIKDLQSRVQEHVKTISDLEQISCLEVQTQLEIQNQEAQNLNAMKAIKITQLEAELQCKENVIRNLQNSKRRISAELRDNDREIDDNITKIEHLGLDLEDSWRRENELSATVSRLELESENAQRENRNLRTGITTCREASSSMKRALDIEREAATKQIEDLHASLQCREQEHLKIISDLAINSHSEKTRLMAQIQEMENAIVNYRVSLESSVDDIIDVKVDEKEIIPSKSRDNGKSTGDKWKKGLLIGGGCVAAAVALRNYGPDLSEVASALNPSRLIGNLF